MSSEEEIIENNENSIELKWLDEIYIKKILESHEKKEINLIRFKIEPATNKCENYASEMHRVQVEYDIINENYNDYKKLSMIVKSRLENELLSEIEEHFNIFERETQIYDQIMKECEELLKTIDDDTKFGPRALYVDSRVIVQEDLKIKGYGILDVKEGLDYQHCLKIFEKLAKFHATTMILYEKNPKIFRYHMKGNITENSTMLIDLYKNLINTCIEYVESDSKLEKYTKNLQDFSEILVKNLINIFTREPNGFNVLNHGDLWVNNLMFKHDKETGEIMDVLLVDYQEGFFGSPGIDFNYFIYTSWKKDVYENHLNDLFYEYHKILKDTLEKLQYNGKIPSLDDVKREILAKGDHGLITAACLRPILVNEHPELSDIAIFLSDTEETRKKRFTVFNNEKFGNFLQLFLEDFLKQAIL